ncbi:unnamed protein product [Phytomonas sp. EM1]|nr:unnamed protein product [Phytomonas sp. EM1]|eukprot:CCW61823.1 unnamed protein product [Phytomonas sp. isolate EM1]
MLPDAPQPLARGIVPYFLAFQGAPPPPSRALQSGCRNGTHDNHNALTYFHPAMTHATELPHHGSVVRFRYDFHCPRCLLKNDFSLDSSVLSAQWGGNMEDNTADGVFSTQHPLGEELEEEVGMMVLKRIPDVEGSTFPCAPIRWAAELFARHYRCHRHQEAATFPGFHLLSSDGILKNSPEVPESVHHHIRQGFDEYNSASNDVARAFFSFRGTRAAEFDNELISSRKDLKFKRGEAKVGGIDSMGSVSRNGRAAIISEGFAAEFAYLLCQSALLLREASEFFGSHSEGIAAALEHVLSVSETGLPDSISKLRSHPERVHAALSSLMGVMHLMFFVLQELDTAITQYRRNPKNTHSSLKPRRFATEGVHKKESKVPNTAPSSHLAPIVSLREFAHALWLHLLDMWPDEVISLGFIEWWLHHPRNSNSGLGIENEDKPSEEQPQGQEEDFFLSTQDATYLSEQIQFHFGQIFYAVVYRIHLMASHETWSLVGGEKPLFQCSSRSYSPQKTRRVSYSDSSYNGRESERTHMEASDDWLAFSFPPLQRHTLPQAQKQAPPGSKSEDQGDFFAQSPHPSFPAGDRHFSVDYSDLWRNDSSPYQNALLAQLLIRFLSSCFVQHCASSQGNHHRLNPSEDNWPSYVLFALCRLCNSIPMTTLFHTERSPSLLSSSFVSTITGSAGVQPSAFLQTLVSVFSEAMRLAAKLAARVGGVRLEMKVDLMCFVGRLLRLRELLVLWSLKSRAEFDAELERLEALLALAK